MRAAFNLVWGACVGLGLSGCGQQDVVLPQQSAGAAGECGPWYPGGDAGVADAGSEEVEEDLEGYGYEIGKTLPCFVWESVRIGPTGPEPNTYINMGEVYLQSKWDAVEDFQDKWGASIAAPNWMLLVLVATTCPTCASYVEDIMSRRADLESRGVAIVGIARSYDLDNTVDLTFAEAEEELMVKGFPEDVHRTNDQERYLGANATLPSGYPQVGLIRLSDMTVVDKTLDPASDPEVLGGAQAILDLIDSHP